MSTYHYYTPWEAVENSRSETPDYRQIVGLKGADAAWVLRTRAGHQRKPESTWEARRYMLQCAREIARVVWTGQDGMDGESNPGSVTVFFADGSHTYIHDGDLLCVERPILGV